MIHVIRNGLHYTSMCLCPCISFARTLFLNALVFSRSVLQYGKVNVIPIMTFLEAQSCQEIAPCQTIPKTIQKRYTKRYFRFRFARHPPFRTSMTSLLLSLLALACAGGQLCRCLCWLVVVLVEVVLVLLLCWWCRSGADLGPGLLLAPWCLLLLGAWCRWWWLWWWCCYPCCCCCRCCLELVPLLVVVVLLLLVVMCSCKRK